jgi:hypothetical protein
MAARKLFGSLCLSILGFAILIAALKAYDRSNDGFSMYQIHSCLPPCPQYGVELSEEKKEFLEQVLDQPFYYLGKGCQFYVFRSQDDKYVIKFIKQKPLRQWTWLDSIPLPSQIRSLLDEKKFRRAERAKRLFSSCLLAYKKLKEETGLLFIHLDRVPTLKKKIIIVDKLGCKHQIALDNYEYCIQIKGNPVEETLLNLKKEELPAKIQQLSNLIALRCKKGIQDRDPPFIKNVVFTDYGPIFADFGQFYEEPTLCQPANEEQEIAYRINLLHQWMEENYLAEN